MSIVTLAEAKQHLEVIGNDQDAKIQRMIDAAEAFASRFMGRPLDPWEEPASSSEASSEQVVPADVKHAILLYVGDFFAIREASITGTIYAKNPAAESLLHWHRRGLGV